MAVRSRLTGTLDPTHSEAQYGSGSPSALTTGRVPAPANVLFVGDPVTALAAQEATEANAAAAAAAASDAAAAQAASEAIMASFDQRFLGAFASAPTTDNSGDPIMEGALYFNTVSGYMFAYHSGAWTATHSYGGVIPVNVINQTTTTMTLDRATREYHRVNLQSPVTSVVLTGWPAGNFARIQLELRNTGAFPVSGWPANVNWVNGSPPTTTVGAGKKDMLVFWSSDGGTEILGASVGQNFMRAP